MPEQATLDHKTFDLAAVLAGMDQPEDTVTVYFDKKLGYTINKLNEAILLAERRNDSETAEELQKELDALVPQVKDAEYTIHLRGVEEGVKKAIIQEVRKNFPPKRNVFGVEEDNFEGDEALAMKFWARYIVKVVDPTGAISLMSEELAQILRDKAPKPAQEAINIGINGLDSGSEEGFNYASKEVDFLLTASTEG